jgi:hypothetical protein
MPEDMQWLPVVHDGDVPQALQKPLYRMWQAIVERAGRPPNRAELGFEQLRPWLGWLSIYDVAAAPPRIALWGTELAASVGRDLTNQPVAGETFGSQTATILAAIRHAAVARMAVRLAGPLAWCGREWRETDALLLPLGEGAAGVTRVVALCTHRKSQDAGAAFVAGNVRAALFAA